MEKQKLSTIFGTFAKVGALTFGGGYTMLPILQREAVQKQGWLTEAEIADYYALSQCSPGLIAVNISIYIGYPLRGFAGALMAALGVITPSVLIIMLLAGVLSNFAHLPLLGHAFAGIRVAVAVLVCQAAYTLLKKGVVDRPAFVIMLAVLVLSLLNLLNPVLVIIAAAVAGVAIQAARLRRGEARR